MKPSSSKKSVSFTGLDGEKVTPFRIVTGSESIGAEVVDAINSHAAGNV